MKTKSDIVLTRLEEEEARAFMRPFAHSVTIARSFKGEEKAADDPQQQQQQKATEPEDPFANIDFDNLPDAVKESLTKARLEFANLQTKATTAEATAKANEELARKHQSRADKFGTVLKQHNLDPDVKATQQSAEDAELETLTQEFVKELGLTPEVAKAHARMHVISYKRGKADILKTVGEAVSPHLQTVGAMSVDRIIQSAEQSEEFNSVLSNADVNTKSREILNTIVHNGGAVDESTVRTAVQMAVGEVTMKGNFQVNTQQTKQQPVINRGNSFLFPPMKQQMGGNRNGAPVAANDDTAKAMARTLEHLSRGLKKK